MMSIRERIRRDDGMSLAELIVAGAISVLLLTMIGAFFTSVVRGVNTSETADTTTRQATTAINTMVQYFHAATTNPVLGQASPDAAIVSAGASDVTFYAYVNLVSTAAKPVKVRFFIDPTTHYLTEQLWASTCSATTLYCTFSSTVTSQLKLGGPVASPTSDGKTPTSAGKPLFTYYDSNNAPVLLSPTTGTVPPINLGSIDYVGIHLELGSTTAGSAGDTHVSTTVGLLNLGQAGTGTS
jgi:hypothetical protein